jgi:hypothetical protein
VRVELRHLGLDTLEQVPDVLGLIELLAHRFQDDRLRELPARKMWGASRSCAARKFCNEIAAGIIPV